MIVAKTFFMNTKTHPHEHPVENKGEEEKKRVESANLTVEDQSQDLPESKMSFMLNHGMLLFNLCS